LQLEFQRAVFCSGLPFWRIHSAFLENGEQPHPSHDAWGFAKAASSPAEGCGFFCA